MHLPVSAGMSFVRLTATLSLAFSSFAALRSPISASAILNTLKERGKPANAFFPLSAVQDVLASASFIL